MSQGSQAFERIQSMIHRRSEWFKTHVARRRHGADQQKRLNGGGRWLGLEALEPRVLLSATLEANDTISQAVLSGSDNVAVTEAAAAPPALLSEDFEGGLGGFTVDNTIGSGNGLWHLSTGREADGLPDHSPIFSLYYGQNEGATGGGDFNTGTANGGAVFSPLVSVPAAGFYELSFNYLLDTENSEFASNFDVVEVAIDDGSGFVTLLSNEFDGGLQETNDQWLTATTDLTPYAGRDITLRFSFETGDSILNNFEGLFIDDVAVTEVPPPVFEDFEGGLGGFTIDNTIGSGNGLWHLSTGREADGLPDHSPIFSLYYGQNEGPTGGGDFNTTGTPNGGAVFSPLVSVPAAGSELSFNYLLDTENFEFATNFDIAEVAIDDGSGFVTLLSNEFDGGLQETNDQWLTATADLTPYAGQDITLRFSFETGDSVSNNFEGWYIDDVDFTEVEPPLLSEDFEEGLGGFTIDNTIGSGNGLWHLSTGREADGLPDHSPIFSLYYGQNEGATGGGDFDTGIANGGAVFSPLVGVPAVGSHELSFNYLLETENFDFASSFDIAEVAIDDGSGFVTLLSNEFDGGLQETGDQWLTATADLTPYAGQDVTLRFSFETGDSVFNNFEGWYIDDVAVTEVIIIDYPIVEDFEEGLGGFTLDNDFGSGGGLWHLSTGREADDLPDHSPSFSLYYGQNEGPIGGGDFNTGTANGGAVFSPLVSVPAVGSHELSFNYLLDTENFEFASSFDIAEVAIDDGSGFVTLLSNEFDGGLQETNDQWLTATADLTPYAGQDITLRFSFETGDPAANDFEGWYIDDVALTEVLLSEDFEDGLGGFTVDNTIGSGNGLWHLSTGREADGLPDHSPIFSLYYGQNEGATGGGDFNTGTANGGAVFSPLVNVPAVGSHELSFNYLLDTENFEFASSFDIAEVAIDDGSGFVTLLSNEFDGGLQETGDQWLTATADLTPYAGQHVTLRFSFETVDSVLNNFEGWYIDDVAVTEVDPIPLSEDFENGLDGFTVDNTIGSGNGLWHLSTGREADGLPDHSPIFSLYYGQNEGPTGGGDFNTTGTANGGAVFSPLVNVPAVGFYELSFNYLLDTENFEFASNFDIVEVAIDDGSGFVTLLSNELNGGLQETNDQWLTATADLTPYAGQDITLRFSFDTGDSVSNNFEGWYIDDVAVTEVEPPFLLSEDFEDGLGGFTVDNTIGSGNGLWHLSTGREADGLPDHSPIFSLYYGQNEGATGGGDFNTGTANGGAVFSPLVNVPAVGSHELSFNYLLDTENFEFASSFDIAEVAIDDGSGFVTLLSNELNGGLQETNDQWLTATADLTPYAGQDVTLRFSFDTVDGVANDFEGWYIDDVAVTEVDPIPLSEDFENGLDGFTVDNTIGSGNGLWHLSTGREADGLPDHSPIFSLYYGQFEGPTGGGDFNTTGTANGGAVFSPLVSVPAVGPYELSFNYLLDTENFEFASSYDIAEVAIDDGSGFVTLLSNEFDGGLQETNDQWLTATADLTPYAGQDVTLRFSFETGDSISNDFEGWYIDDVLIDLVSLA